MAAAAAPTAHGLGASMAAGWRRERAHLARCRFDRALLTWVPLLLAALVVWIFDAGVPRGLPVAVLDQDHSALSRQVQRLLQAAPTLHVAERPADAAQAEAALRAARVYAVVVVPAGLEADIRRGRAGTVTLLHDAQFGTHSGLIQRDVRGAIATLALGLEMRQRAARGEPAAQGQARASPLQARPLALFNGAGNYERFLALAIIPALLHVLAMSTGAWSVAREKRSGALREWLGGATRAQAVAAIAGKLVWPWALLTLAGSVALVAATVGRGWPVAGSLGLTLMGLAALLAVSVALGGALAGLVTDPAASLSAAAFLSAPAFAFSGLAFPLSAMSGPARAWAEAMPFTHYLRLQVQQLVMGVPVRHSVPIAAALLAAALVALVLAGWLARVRPPPGAGKRGAAEDAARATGATPMRGTGPAPTLGAGLAAAAPGLRAAARATWRAVWHDKVVLVLLFASPIVYGFFYPWFYTGEVVRRVPVAVVDHDGSALARQITRLAAASPRLHVVMAGSDEGAVQRALAQGHIEGYLVLPPALQHDVARGRPVTLPIVGNGAYALLNKTVQTGLLEVVETASAGIEARQLQARGHTPAQAAVQRMPLRVAAVARFNPAEGYGSFVVPAVALLILHQTLLVGAATVVGEAAWRGRAGASAREWLGRVLALSVFGWLAGALYFGWLFVVQGYPHGGNLGAALGLLLVFSPAVAALGCVIGAALGRRERALRALPATTLPLAFMAGFSWPVQALPPALQALRWALPAHAGIQASLRFNQLGAPWSAGAPDVLALAVGLAAALAVLAWRWPRRGQGEPPQAVSEPPRQAPGRSA